MVGYDGSKKVLESKHAAVNGNSLPSSILLGPANEHDTGKLIPVMKDTRIMTGARPSRLVYADKACDSFFVRTYPSLHKIKARIARLSIRKKKLDQLCQMKMRPKGTEHMLGGSSHG